LGFAGKVHHAQKVMLAERLCSFDESLSFFFGNFQKSGIRSSKFGEIQVSKMFGQCDQKLLDVMSLKEQIVHNLHSAGRILSQNAVGEFEQSIITDHIQGVENCSVLDVVAAERYDLVQNTEGIAQCSISFASD
jgi:hypothetical protein